MASVRLGMAKATPRPTASPSLAHLLHDLVLPSQRLLPTSSPALDERPLALTDGDLHDLATALNTFLHTQFKRQGTQGTGAGQTFEGYPDCTNVGNAVLSCYPTEDTVIVQNTWSRFVFNARYPTFVGAGAVDIYLWHADSETIAANYTDIPTARGMIAIQPDDSWLPTQISWTTGQNVTWPFYFQIVPAGQALTGAESRLAEFQMIQTAPPATLSAAFAASSAAISASSVLAVLASASSLSSLGSALGAGVTTLAPGELASYSSAIAGLSSGLSEAVSGGRPTSQSTRGSLASDSNDDGGFPAYGIAILAVLGGFLLIFALATAFLLLRLHRRRQRSGSQDSEAALKQPILGANGEGELQSPIEKDGGSPTSDRGGFPATVAGAAAAGGAIAARSRGPTDSRGRSSAGDGTVGEDSAISTTDAALMAEAFRKALRAPEFPAGGSNDHSPSSGTGTVAASSSEQAAFAAAAEANSSAAARPRSRLSSTAVDEGGEAEQAGRELIDKELASEGRSMRSVTDLKRAALVDADRGEGPRRPPSLPPSP